MTSVRECPVRTFDGGETVVTERPAEWVCEVCGRSFPAMNNADECERSCKERRNINWEGRILKREVKRARENEVRVISVGRKRGDRSILYDAHEMIIDDNGAKASLGSLFDPVSVDAADSVEITAEECERYKMQAIAKFTEAVNGMNGSEHPAIKTDFPAKNKQ